MAEQDSNRITYTRILKLIHEYDSVLMHQPPLRETIFLSKMNLYSIRSYYKLRNELKAFKIDSPIIRKLINKMPAHVWLLGKYVMEILLLFFVIVSLIPYMFLIPTYNGQFSFYVGAVILIWYFLRRRIYFLDERLFYSISDLKKELNKELKMKKQKFTT
jgi:hypothetical protein